MVWSRIKGHDELIASFERVVRRGRLAHAYLFTGPGGIGKRLLAGELGKALLCEGKAKGRLEACDACEACSLVDAQTHPDFFTAGRPEDSLELPIDAVRQLCKDLSMKPARGGHKIAILDDADDLNEESGNCFLKTLEEPPPGSVLILIATSSERQLSTIVSRCQVIRFPPLPGPLVAELLRAQGVEDPAQVERLARLSGGSPGQALALADPALWEFRRTFLAGLTKSPIDSVDLAQTLTRFVEEAGKESGAQRRRASLVLRLVIEFLNDGLRRSVGEAPRLNDPEDLRFLSELEKRVSEEQLLELIERCLEGDYQIDRRAQLVLVLEALVDALGQKMAGAAS